MLHLEITKRTDPQLLERMQHHYSHLKGFVGRNICYAVYWNSVYFGHIVGGSAALHVQGRNNFLGNVPDLNSVVNNIFYNVGIPNTVYPCRNFTTLIVKTWEKVIAEDWQSKYGDKVVAFETFVLPPRTGELYYKAGWELIGTTKGKSCKRVAGKGNDGWGGKRIWTIGEPKLIFMKKIE